MSRNGRVDLASMFLMFFSQLSQVVLFLMCFQYLLSRAIVKIGFRSALRLSSKPVSRLHLFFLNMWWSYQYHLKESDVRKPRGTQSRETSGYVTTDLYIHTQIPFSFKDDINPL